MKFLIELEATGCNGLGRQRVADGIDTALEDSNVSDVLAAAMFKVLDDGRGDGPSVGSMRVLEDAPRVVVDHLTVYVSPQYGRERYCVDHDHADDEHGRRTPGGNGKRFSSPELAGEYVAQQLRALDEEGAAQSQTDDEAKPTFGPWVQEVLEALGQLRWDDLWGSLTRPSDEKGAIFQEIYEGFLEGKNPTVVADLIDERYGFGLWSWVDH